MLAELSRRLGGGAWNVAGSSDAHAAYVATAAAACFAPAAVGCGHQMVLRVEGAIGGLAAKGASDGRSAGLCGCSCNTVELS